MYFTDPLDPLCLDKVYVNKRKYLAIFCLSLKDIIYGLQTFVVRGRVRSSSAQLSHNTTNETSEHNTFEGAFQDTQGMPKVPHATHGVASNLGDHSQETSCENETLDLSTDFW